MGRGGRRVTLVLGPGDRPARGGAAATASTWSSSARRRCRALARRCRREVARGCSPTCCSAPATITPASPPGRSCGSGALPRRSSPRCRTRSAAATTARWSIVGASRAGWRCTARFLDHLVAMTPATAAEAARATRHGGAGRAPSPTRRRCPAPTAPLPPLPDRAASSSASAGWCAQKRWDRLIAAMPALPGAPRRHPGRRAGARAP